MWADNETSEDLLGFKVHANLITNFITNKNLLPLSIGIYGDWGSGKSSVMKMLVENLEQISQDKNTPRIQNIYFNGWQFEGYDDSKLALIETILAELKKNQTVYNKASAKINDLLRSINWLKVGGSFVKHVAIPGSAAIATNGLTLIPTAIEQISKILDSPDSLIEELKTQPGKDKLSRLSTFFKKESEKEQVSEIVRNFRKKFEELITETELDCLVVTIDDLDRCSPERIIENLEAIKLFLNVKNTAFIIGADERIVRHAVEYRYKANNVNSDEIDNYSTIITDYLEKIIQIPYKLPKLSSSDVETYMSLLICKRDLELDKFTIVLKDYYKFREEDKHSVYNFKQIEKVVKAGTMPEDLPLVSRISSLITEVLKGNPRQIKRFLNLFMIRKELSEVAKFPDIKYEILTKLMVLEYIKIERFRDLFYWQEKGKGLSKELAEIEKHFQDTPKDKIRKEYSSWGKLGKWVSLEPQLKEVNLADYFWLSRDRLSSCIDGSNMISNQVRNIFNEIIDSTTSKDLAKQIRDKINGQLNESEIDNFYRLMRSHTLMHIEDESLFNIYHELIHQEVYNSVIEYTELLKLADVDKIPPEVAFNCANIAKQYDDILKVVGSLKEDSRFVKAFNQRFKKGNK